MRTHSLWPAEDWQRTSQCSVKSSSSSSFSNSHIPFNLLAARYYLIHSLAYLADTFILVNMNALNINLKDKDLTVILTHDKFTVTKKEAWILVFKWKKSSIELPSRSGNFLSENNFMTDVFVRNDTILWMSAWQTTFNKWVFSLKTGNCDTIHAGAYSLSLLIKRRSTE